MKHFLGMILALGLAGCDYNPEKTKSDFDTSYYDPVKQNYEVSQLPKIDTGHIQTIFNDFGMILPNGNRIRVCSGGQCNHQQLVRIQPTILRQCREFLSKATDAITEREALKKCLPVIETEIARLTGLSSDKAGKSWLNKGIISQLDDLDEALNTTSIMLVLYRYELVRFHNLYGPVVPYGTWKVQINDRIATENVIYYIDTGVNDSGGEVDISNSSQIFR